MLLLLLVLRQFCSCVRGNLNEQYMWGFFQIFSYHPLNWEFYWPFRGHFTGGCVNLISVTSHMNLSSSITSAWQKWQQLSWRRQQSGVWRGRSARIRRKRQPVLWPWSSVRGPWTESLSAKRKLKVTHISRNRESVLELVVAWHELSGYSDWLTGRSIDWSGIDWNYSELHNTSNAFTTVTDIEQKFKIRTYLKILLNLHVSWECMYTSDKEHYFWTVLVNNLLLSNPNATTVTDVIKLFSYIRVM